MAARKRFIYFTAVAQEDIEELQGMSDSMKVAEWAEGHMDNMDTDSKKAFKRIMGNKKYAVKLTVNHLTTATSCSIKLSYF